MNDPCPPHPLMELLRSKGLSLADAGAYALRLKFIAQVGFARGADPDLAATRAARDALLAAARRGARRLEMNADIFAALAGAEPQPKDIVFVDGQRELTTNFKKSLAQRYGKTWRPEAQLKAGDFGRDEFVDLASGSDISKVPVDSWERASWKAHALTGLAPSMLDGTSPADAGTFRLDPQATEEALQGRALGLMDRFGLGGVRVGGLPSLEVVQGVLDSLELALAEIAKQAGIPERAVGAGGWTIHANAPLNAGSGLCDEASKTICLSGDNGWRTLAHEWFHAFEGQAARSLGLSSSALSVVQNTPALAGALPARLPPEQWDAKRLAAYREAPEASPKADPGRLLESAAAIWAGLRHAPGRSGLETLLQEERAISIERMRQGLFERFYANRVEPQLREQASSSFGELAEGILDGRLGLPEISAWRQKHLGDKAQLCKHYDAFLMAERAARDARAQERALDANESASAMEMFARLADQHLAAASGDKSWEGYSSSSVEMGARGFEGNFFLDTPAKLHPYLTDARDGSLYWPVAHERGANAGAYRLFFAQATVAMVNAGALPADTLADPKPLVPTLDIQTKRRERSGKPSASTSRSFGL